LNADVNGLDYDSQVESICKSPEFRETDQDDMIAPEVSLNPLPAYEEAKYRAPIQSIDEIFLS
jgi:hypothetical protein